MMRIGLTGGIGMGKSTVSEFLVQHRMPIIDTDQLARQVVEPGQPALDDIVDAFGQDILNSDGSLNRQALGAIVFNNPEQLATLNAITHPRIRLAWEAFLEAQESAGQSAACVIIPLLFETGTESAFDHILCTACSPETQNQRLLSRGWSPQHIAQRIDSQWPVARKISLSHFLLWNDGSLECLHQQISMILDSLNLLKSPQP